MRLIPVPIDDEALEDMARHWMPFLPMIAKRSKETFTALLARVMNKEMRLTLVWDDTTGKAVGLIGVRLHYRGADLIGELLWTAGHGRHRWQHLLSDLENLLRDAGVKECRPLCRPGWSKLLKRHGYRMTHVQFEKVL
jgi:hypothetical protein